ncbi:juvenile hormone acid O-methyltransferase-like [Ixodes scapularis]|uniref:juvenile hormone acid O-methyltransferase-like n=1 Tax=Ixodes scapularis TaxID=6945 RepID=UPI001C382C06|nr:juvenile hormone acid O-methyltransferase-like [Ixodes scapularis]
MCVVISAKLCACINELARQNATYYKPADSPDRLRLVKMTALTPVTTVRSLNGETAPATIDPEVYITTNGRERQHNLEVLNLLQASFMNETNDQQFLDLGCGTGDFTRDHLLPRCPDVKRIVAVDVSQDMVEYAKKHFDHSKICYDVLDISGNGVADFVQRYGEFDRVYSFFCLNWLVDQEKGFDNIAELMKPGGGCLLFFAGSSSAMRLKRRLATITNWQKYRKVSRHLAPLNTNAVQTPPWSPKNTENGSS